MPTYGWIIVIALVTVVAAAIAITGLKKNKAQAAPPSSSRPSSSQYQVADIYKGLRQQAFKRWEMKPQSAEGMSADGGQTPSGVLMETGYRGAVATLVAFDSGDASLYFSNGGGVIGGIGHEMVSAAARRLVEQAGTSLGSMSKSQETPLPPPGMTRFSVLTGSGIFTAEVAENDLGSGKHTLSPLFYAGQEVITQLRLVTEKK